MLSSARLFEEAQNQIDHNRLLSLINSLSDGFLAINEDGLIELCNGVALSLLDTNSLNGKALDSAIPLIDSAGAPQKLLEMARTSTPNFISRDYRLKYTDGSVINLYVNVSPVRRAFGGHGKGGFVVLFRDITREKNVEDERDEFISVASHELRNPVAVAEGGISNALLLAQRDNVPDNIIRALKSAHEQVLFIGSLINDLAMISRADREKLIQSAEEFDAAEVAQSLQKDYTAQAQKKGLEIKLDTQALPKIFGSRLYTREILQNFITNALKYTEKGAITIRAAASSKGVDLSVADSGIGIDEEEQRKLFTKFFRSEDSRVRQISGTGLGLYVSAKLADLMGGRITMSSELNRGSVFTLHLPNIVPGKTAAPGSKVIA